MSRKWHKCISMKQAHEVIGIYSGSWSTQMDRYWESDDGYTVSSRQILTTLGVVEHVAIGRFGLSFTGEGDIPWAVKQEIKNELFGDRRVAIEVYPDKKHLVDVCDVYHLWVLPKGFSMPFGIHPTRDPECKVVERGYDCDYEACLAWTESLERKRLMGEVKEVENGLTED